MTYQEFKNKYNGQYLDWDGAYGPQCWDLAQVYVTECLGLPSWVLSGCGVASNLLNHPKIDDLLTYFYEVPTTEMKPGDICIWKYYSDDAGHIALYDSWNGYECFYFTQNPGPSRVEALYGGEMHSFRLKEGKEVTPNVPRDENKNQIEVKVEDLRVRVNPGVNSEIVGYAKPGFYNYNKTEPDVDGYGWYRIADNQWVAYNEEWFNVYPAKEDEYFKVKILEKKDGYVLLDLGQVWVKE